MAEEFQLGNANWWESSPSSSSTTTSSRLLSSGSSSSSSSTISSSTLTHHNNNNDVVMGNNLLGCWPSSTHLVLDTKPKSSLDSVPGDDGGALLSDPHGFYMMGLGLPSSRPIPWNNQGLFSNPNFHQESSYDYNKQMNRLSLDQSTPQFLSRSDLNSAPPVDFSYDVSTNYGMMKQSGGIGGDDVMSPSFPQFLRPKPPSPSPPPQLPTQLQFSNNTSFWNAMNNDAQFSFLPVDQKPKNNNTSEGRDSSSMVTKKSNECSSKRPRDQNETPAPMPAFKVKKEKMGDRITALQQLISPFGKTDTASVLSEAIEYIKFLHDQVNILSTPYMKSGASMRQQNFEKSKNQEISRRQDLKSRGLCLVPISSTFPVTPTFGGCFR